MTKTRHLVLVLGDQLDHQAAAFDGFDPLRDRSLDGGGRGRIDPRLGVQAAHSGVSVGHAAISGEELLGRGLPSSVRSTGRPGKHVGLWRGVTCDGRSSLFKPSSIVMTAPGDWRALTSIRETAKDLGVPLDILEDRHFFSTVRDFAEHARDRKQLRLEYWYRELRQKTGVLMDGSKPVGGQWNFDEDNRESFGKDGPPPIPPPTRFEPDSITREVINLVNDRFADHPGEVSASADGFGWPVTRSQALQVLDDFINQRLPNFGRYQDAMWAGEPWLFHSHLAVALNLKLLSAREVVAAAEQAFHQGKAPLSSVEGFIRQILGWREYVRGIYWTQMPDYLERNHLNATNPLPDFFWTGETDAACLRDAITQTLKTGYAHHIQRLMVTGLYCLLVGIDPKQVHEWYLSVYVDAVEWVELPNTLGMSQYADGGLMTSKPYAATGKYIDRMSNYCKGCRYNPNESTGHKACPFTRMYWDFLLRHRELLAKNPRMVMQIRNLDRRLSSRK